MRTLVATLTALMLFAAMPVAAGDDDHVFVVIECKPAYGETGSTTFTFDRREAATCTDTRLEWGQISSDDGWGSKYIINLVDRYAYKKQYFGNSFELHQFHSCRQVTGRYRLFGKSHNCNSLSLSAATPVESDDYGAGLSAAANKDWQKAFNIWMPLAEQGNARAEYWIGNMYEHGYAVPQNNAKAIYWYTRAAKQSDAGARGKLGTMYLKGQDLPPGRVAAYAQASIRGALDPSVAKMAEAFGECMTPDEIAEAQVAVRKFWETYAWLRILAAQDDAIEKKAEENLGELPTPTQIANARKALCKFLETGNLADLFKYMLEE
ncbi:MAG: sel1 repeat family protein [Rhodospirillaceae bacterium]|nr:sel1 repeat family protein [Rhodospirillaceae bacterium]